MKLSLTPPSITHGAVGCPSQDEQLQQDVCATLIATPGLDARAIEVGLLGHGRVWLGGSAH